MLLRVVLLDIVSGAELFVWPRNVFRLYAHQQLSSPKHFAAFQPVQPYYRGAVFHCSRSQSCRDSSGRLKVHLQSVPWMSLKSRAVLHTTMRGFSGCQCTFITSPSVRSRFRNAEYFYGPTPLCFGSIFRYDIWRDYSRTSTFLRKAVRPSDGSPARTHDCFRGWETIRTTSMDTPSNCVPTREAAVKRGDWNSLQRLIVPGRE